MILVLLSCNIKEMGKLTSLLKMRYHGDGLWRITEYLPCSFIKLLVIIRHLLCYCFSTRARDLQLAKFFLTRRACAQLVMPTDLCNVVLKKQLILQQLFWVKSSTKGVSFCKRQKETKAFHIPKDSL